MRTRRRALTVVLAAGAIAIAPAISASAAGAAIHTGDSLYAISTDPSYPDLQLMHVDPTSGLSTTIGAGSAATSGQAYQPAHNPVTGESYYVVDNARGAFFLMQLDVTTGDSTLIGEFEDIGSGLFPGISAIMIGLDGSAYAMDTAQSTMYQLDLATAHIGPVGIAPFPGWAFSVDPTTGDFWAVDSTNRVWTAPAALPDAWSNYGIVVLPDPANQFAYSLQIDRSGTFWLAATDNSVGGAGLWSFTPLTLPTPVYSGPFVDGPYFTSAILITPSPVTPPVPPAGPQLANGGVDYSAAVGVALGAGILLTAGLVVVTRRRSAS